MSEAPLGLLRLTPVQLASLTAVLLLAFGASLGMPFTIDAIALSFDTNNTGAGLVATVEMAAIAAGTLTFARLANRFPPQRIYWFGVSVVIAVNGASIFAPEVAWLTALRLPAGFALGAVVATVMATAGKAEKPEFNFGIINAMVGVMGLIMAFVLPRALDLHLLLPVPGAYSPLDGLYLVYALLSLLALLFIRTTPTPAEPVPGAPAAPPPPPQTVTGWLALAGLASLFFGHALVALFLVKIGRTLELTPETVGYVFMAGGVLAIVLPMLAGYLGTRTPALPVVAVLCLALIATALVLVSASRPLGYLLSGPLFASLPVAIMPLYLGALARLDPSGRLTGAHPAFVMLGGAVAPLAGGSLSDAGGYLLNGMVASGCFALGLLLALPALRQADRQRHQPREIGIQPAGG